MYWRGLELYIEDFDNNVCLYISQFYQQSFSLIDTQKGIFDHFLETDCQGFLIQSFSVAWYASCWKKNWKQKTKNYKQTNKRKKKMILSLSNCQ